ncbi:cell wall-binding repeat-containing protein [Euzebya rosea]|uniref:cell wall-binding repeat-containing protein n=1 Tax=Euzebya rosea TaxID=2052804 RepID=UPI000D3E106D|nr:cell wall-binding repeat-containing protein [Euzebya rosea]
MSASLLSTRVRGVVILLAALLVLPLAIPAAADVSDTISVIKEGETLDTVEIVSRLAEATFDGPTQRVLIGREDQFADNMASAVMQAEAPLLLVPTEGPISQRVRDLLATYDPSEVVLLGGEAALSADVERELAADYQVTRRSGPTRFETAINIAEVEAPTANTALLARGFAAEGSTDASQAFADSLAAGGWAADEGWPILLTPTDTLPGSVRAYLERSSIDTMMIMGGTAAISETVENELEEMGIATTRVAGPTRFDTAIAVAEMRGVDNASDAGRVILVEGQAEDAWAGGFAAAAHSAEFDAPIVLANGDGLPGSTTDFLTPPGGFAQTDFFDNAVLTCATLPSTCELARVTRGLPPQADVTFTPASGATIPVGSTVEIAIVGENAEAGTATGDCIADTPVSGTTDVAIAGPPTTSCVVTVTLDLPGGSTQVDTATYTIVPADGGILTANLGEAYAYVPGLEEVLVTIGTDDTFLVDGQPASEAVFLQQATVGDVVSNNGSGFAQGGVEHSLVNIDPLDYTSGVVGNVDLIGGQADIIEPVSGVELRTFDLPGGLYTVDGVNAPLSSLEEDINEGDTVVLGQTAAEVPTIDLTNASVSGPVFDFATFDGSFGLQMRIDSGGLPDSPMLGDVPFHSSDLRFEANDGPSYDYEVDGVAADYSQFDLALSEGDVLTYSRQDDVEVFSLVNAIAAGTTGLATQFYDLSDAGQVDLLVPGQGPVTRTIDLTGGTYVVDGVLSTIGDLQEAWSPGDRVTVVPASSETPQRVELVNQFLSGSPTDVQTAATSPSYDVVTADGTVYNDLPYTGDPFRDGGSVQNRYYVDGTEVTPDVFETALADADPDVATIEVRRAGDDLPGGGTVGVANQHRLAPTG